HSPDLILLDLILPDMNPEETIKALRAVPSAAATPILAFTALDTFEIHRRHLGAEIAGFIPKPYETYELLGKINGILDPGADSEYGRLTPET
ncbi:MAG TPA: hypothetical protein DCZ92_11505, partial [Elusimicrobia bacterium]|nr:hypothetical protein [Elusimicrobiota bacterium]